MSDQLTGLLVTLLTAALCWALAIVIRIRGPVGLVNGVDWRRVSNPQALGRFASLILLLIGAIACAMGVAIYALFDNHPLLNIVVVVSVASICALSAIAVIGTLRYQDRPVPKDHGNRR